MCIHLNVHLPGVWVQFKQMRVSLERRMSRSSSSIPRSSRDHRSLDRLSRDRLSRDARVPQPLSFAASSTACLPPKVPLSPQAVAMSRAEQRRSNLGVSPAFRSIDPFIE